MYLTLAQAIARLNSSASSIDSGQTSKLRQIVVLAELSDSGTIGAYEYLAGVRPIYGIVSMDVVIDKNFLSKSGVPKE
jgi:hypothetical protein